MSVLTTQPEMQTSVSSRSKAQSVAGDSPRRRCELLTDTRARSAKICGGTGTYTVCFRRPHRRYACLTPHRRL